MHLFKFEEFNEDDGNRIIEALRNGEAMAVRDVSCALGHRWPATVVFSPHATTISGEAMLGKCPNCKHEGMTASPWRILMTVPLLYEFKPDSGDHMTVQEFRDNVEASSFVDYDGSGYLATEDMTSHITIRPSDIPFGRGELPEWATHVLWFNR